MGRLIPPLPLARDNRTTGFDCSIASLNEWLIRRALKNDLHGGSRTYVVCDGKQVVGYYAVAAGILPVRRLQVQSEGICPIPYPQ